MNLCSSNIDSACPSLLNLQVIAPDGSTRNHELPFGNVLIVGSSSACGLRLESPNVAGMHCTIEFNDSGITIRDWSTESGTFLDGCRIMEEKADSDRFELEVAGFRIRSHITTINVSQQSAVSSSLSSDAIGSPKTKEEIDLNIGRACGVDDWTSEPDDVRYKLDEGTSEPHVAHQSADWQPSSMAEDLQATFGGESPAAEDSIANDQWNRDFDPWDSPDDGEIPATDNCPPSIPDSDQPVIFREDATELLQVEVDFLRSELADRDERLRELEELAELETDSFSSEETVPASEVEALVGRLEQLLVELEQSDTRIATLNDLLLTSEQAVQTSEEERGQLDAWVSEVDRRVGQWQEEWHAERDSMRKNIDELTEQRDRAEQRLATGASNESAGSARDELVRELREEYTRLKAVFLSTEQERDQLRSRMQDASFTDVEQRVAAEIEAALREERLQLAQEKASLAREMADLGTKEKELQDHLDRKAQTTDNADHRIRAFREHLREIHEHEPGGPQGPTLSQRMGKLWRKLEGRPLDTD